MARPSKTDTLDLSKACELTAGAIDRLTCPSGKEQAFLRDSKAPGLRVRVTVLGAKSYVFEAKLNRQTIRRTIGDVRAWSIEAARVEANRLRVVLDGGEDPREIERQKEADKAAQAEADKASSLTVAEVWPLYLAEGKPKRRTAWKPGYRADLEAAASMGGVPKKRGQGLTKPGPLAALMVMPLASIDQDLIRDWYAKEAQTAPYQAGRAMAMFSGFLGWCATKRDYRALVDKTAARASELGDVLPQLNKRTDCIEIDQLPAWFASTDKLRSRVAAAYLQCLVLTGARREEMAALRWADVDFQWSKLTLADKVEDTRTIPLSPYVASLLAGLPRAGKLKNGEANPFVFASTMSASGRITEPRAPLEEVLADAGIPHMTIHGLRRTFSLLGEAAGAPAGAIAQVMGHKPSATAEGYRPRSIDALRPYLALIEAFILEKAGIAFDPAAAGAGGLKLVASA
ncbi:MAG: integrase family protein [Paucibacter sp.]|nr:integrase family protein [Roseateles sp.]